ncbi:MAG: acetyl-CoA acetyltransferase [Acidimicrobiia bacterium]|nr:acetyl-CoA acetyltransferase [Acidimicrobiia bacterium]MYB74435.1 acetyl-CoA acetyltransferase [Acidimicrobiia bacterium]MYI00203.1 acetyl-CoA acetyltransferase [Acidimicrobiia bacterium]
MVSSHPFRDRAAIAGIGITELSKNSGVSTLTLALRAIMAAIDDAGLRREDIDGVACHQVQDSITASIVAQCLGVDDLSWFCDQFGGGSTSHSVVGQAANAAALGHARHIVVWRSINARSEHRMGGTGRPPPAIVETQYQHPIGWVTPPQWYAMFARSHMSRWGTTSEDLGRIAVQQRANAAHNERAMMRAPMTMDDYLASRWIVEPFRLFDCCLETDAAAAVVITTAERARDLRQPPALISGMTWGGGHMMHSNRVQADWTTSIAAKMARRLYDMAGVGPDDVQYASLYDAFTHLVLVQVEDYGFAPKGEAAAFIAEGGSAPGGRIPVNTHGGFLSEGYVHGLNNLHEAVRQVRGTAGRFQVPGAEVALSTGQPGYVAGNSSAIILRRDS